VHNAVANSVHIGANAFALFLKSQRKWVNPPILQDHADSFHENCKSHSYDQGKHVVPHGSYLVNMAHTDPARTQQAYDSYVDDLRRCDKLGIRLYNIHPGNTVSNDRQTAIAHLAKNINRAHKEVPNVTTLLENMAAGGNVLGSTFEDIRDTIALVEDKSRIGVCMDTCHAFAAGYDLRSPAAFEETLSQFEDIVGFKYLRAVHLNDSKAPFASHRDLHANIGTGFLGLRAFHNLVNDSRFTGLPLVLETPIDETDAEGTPILDAKGKQKENKNIWATEIKLLESLVGMDADSKEFLIIEKELARKGEPERKRLAEQQERKKEKEAKKAAKGTKGKKRTTKKDDTESDASELSNEE
jgi:AP endonuclease-1